MSIVSKLGGVTHFCISCIISFPMFQTISNALPPLFEMTQRDIQQRRDGHRHLNSDVASRARDRALIPDLFHRRNDERKAQRRRRQSSYAEWELRRHVPGLEVVQCKVCFAEVEVLYQDCS